MELWSLSSIPGVISQNYKIFFFEQEQNFFGKNPLGLSGQMLLYHLPCTPCFLKVAAN